LHSPIVQANKKVDLLMTAKEKIIQAVETILADRLWSILFL